MAKKKKSEPISREEVKKQLAELVKLIQVNPKYKNKLDSKQEEPNDTLQDLINFLRVAIKYELFDLNAHRLEIEYLQKILKENGIGWDKRKKK